MSNGGATSNGCVGGGRVSHLQAAGDAMVGAEQVLIEGWCQLFPSHSVDDLAFAADGALYASGCVGRQRQLAAVRPGWARPRSRKVFVVASKSPMAPVRRTRYTASMHRVIASIAIGLAMAGCAAQQGLSSALREALRREGPESMPLRPVASDDGEVSFQVEAQSQPIIERSRADSEGGTWEIDIPIGADTPINCWLTDRPVAIAATAAEFLSRKLVEDASSQEIAGIDASVVGGTPYLTADVIGVAEENGSNALYRAKLFFAPVGLGALRCVHVGLGYQATVQRVLSGMLTTLQVGADAARQPQPAYVDVSLTRLGPLTCGFTELRAYRGDGGRWVTVSRSVLLEPRSRGEAVGLDQVRLTVADAGGVIEQASADAVNAGEKLHSLELTRAPDGSYAVQGEVRGTRIDGGLESAVPLRDDLSLARLIAGAPEGGTVTAAQWMPDVSPLEPVEVSIACPARRGVADIPCRIDAGSVSVDAFIDRSGMASRATYTTGNVELQIERAYSSGAF